ncbi:uncharacterized protein LOC114286976 [Camellia sinensis]|uniref:uncharacterized protein LOC114286976 n=1 Tax=Camellia sinensis TaxID=4442 RepID=UPI001036C39A|nr:uncharacterized protein LOC114286976 [Camellia sinensis]
MRGLDLSLVTHHLDTFPNSKPIKQHARKYHPDLEAKIKEEVEKLQRAKFIELIQYLTWLVNIVPMKKNGQIRVCVDFHDLNKAYLKDEFPLSHIDTLVDSTAGHQMFSFMDEFNGYNQIKMAPEDIETTVFRTPLRNFFYIVMPVGLKNSRATYQCAMTAVFHDMLHHEVEVYVDDLCALRVTVGKFLGFLVHQCGNEVDGDKIKSIMEMPPPHSQKALKKFLGKVSYLRMLILTLAEITFSFGTLLKGNHKFEWLPEHQQAFDMVVTRSDLVRYLLNKPALTKRMTRWLLALVEYDITCVTPKAIKSQTLADLFAQFPSSEHELAEVPLPGEVHVSAVAVETYWDLKFDGASRARKCGAGITPTNQKGEKFHLSYKLHFECSNNEAEYEALILGLIATQKKGLRKLKIWGNSKLVVKQTMGDFTLKEPLLAPYCTIDQKLLIQFDDVQILHTPQTRNRFPDALATLGAKVDIPDDSIAIVIEKRTTPTVLAKKHTEQNTKGWKTDIIQQLKIGQGTIRPVELASSLLLKGELYFRGPNNLLARCIGRQEVTYRLKQIHAKSCGDRDISLYRRIQVQGYCWPEMEKGKYRVVEAMCKMSVPS